jgi:uncharacterized protein HemX
MDQPPGSTEEPGVWQRFWDWFEEGTTTAKILTAVVAVVVVLGVAFGLINGVVGQGSTGTSRSEQLDSYLSEYGGDRDVYIRILTTETCGQLQEEFDSAEADRESEEPGSELHQANLGYMTAADDMTGAAGCAD